MVPVTIDARTGYLANEWCPITQRDYYKPGTVPTDPCPVHSAPPPEPDTIDTMPPNPIDAIGRGLGGLLRRVFGHH